MPDAVSVAIRNSVDLSSISLYATAVTPCAVHDSWFTYSCNGISYIPHVNNRSYLHKTIMVMKTMINENHLRVQL